MTEDKAQLKCQICDSKRLLTYEEVTESIEIIMKRNFKPDDILGIWSLYDGHTCPEGGNHSYEWNSAFREDIMNKADKRKKMDGEIVRRNNRCEELARTAEKSKVDRDQKIKEIIANGEKEEQKIHEEITENEKAIEELEILMPSLEEEILNTSGRSWIEWSD
jgi:hypothetical protein